MAKAPVSEKDISQEEATTEEHPILEGQDVSEEADVPELSDKVSQEEDPTPEPQSEETPAFVSELSELGFEGVEDENQGVQRLLESYRQQQQQLEEYNKDRERLSQLAEYGNQYLQQLRQQQQPKQEEPKQEEKPWWAPPDFEPAWLEKYREVDPDSGQIRWKENTPANIRAQSEAYADYVSSWADRFTHDPVEALTPFRQEVLSEARQLFEQMYEERRAREQEEQFYDRIRKENSWMYEIDPRTNQPTDRFSEAGNRMVELLGEAQDLGITDSQKQWEYAHKLFQAENPSGQPTPQSIAARATAEQKRQQHLKRAAAAPNRSGSAPAREDGASQPIRNVNNTRGQDFLQELEAAGVGIL